MTLVMFDYRVGKILQNRQCQILTGSTIKSMESSVLKSHLCVLSIEPLTLLVELHVPLIDVVNVIVRVVTTSPEMQSFRECTSEFIMLSTC